MRYLILNKNIESDEINSRMKYIYKVTNMYFVPYKTNEGIEFISIPSNIIDCLLIVGHNNNVKKYLINNKIIEDNIIIVSCKFDIDRKFRKNKNIYVSYNDDGLTDYFNGTDWNLNFNVSMPELKLINSKGSFLDRVKKIFRRLK